MAAARQPIAPIFVRVTQAQERFGFSRATAYRWAAQGHFRIYRRGNLAFLKVEEVDAYMVGGAS